MILATSILTFEFPFTLANHQNIEAIDGVEVHAISDDQLQVVICIERPTLHEIEKLDEVLRAIPGVIDVAHHAANFEAEVNAL